MICTKTYKYSYLYNFVQVSFAEDPMRPERARRRTKKGRRGAAPCRDSSILLLEFRRIRPACRRNNAVLAKIDCRLAVVIRHVPERRRSPAPGACWARRTGRPPDRTYFLP